MNTKALGRASIIFLALLLLSACANQLSGSERTAVEFYKSVWVEGNLEQAERLVSDRVNLQEVRWRVADTREEEMDNPPILVVESPTDTQMINTRTILIHRPSDKRDYRVTVRRIPGGNWRVIRFQQNYDKDRGGYIGNNPYQRLVQEFPGLNWKRVETP
ncbi:hypothetical protein [Desmospora profundinema]|uniref:DUF4878 domain-containing protein n=1 Tax=Desmospora profundinema TaxID=1571184 RepID=A0ABU1INK5_9BACL|nr:hypothetical protein [Desmospora profundinema]MDR6226366.1 hypothetical protein [Desmospora profundinema]